MSHLKEMLNIPYNRGQIITVVLLSTFIVLCFFFSGFVLQSFREYKNFKLEENRIEAKLAQTQEELEHQEIYLSLLEDPDFLERVARERLGYARPDELLFRFSDEL